jgi:DNA-binding MarR family transcriptional regulator
MYEINEDKFWLIVKNLAPLNHPAINSKRKLVLTVLNITPLEEDKIYLDGVPLDTLSKWTHLSKPTLKKHLKVLIDEGFVVMTGRDKYQLNQKALLN